MPPEKTLIRKIIRDAFISILLYALPVLLMLLSFYIGGERPWKNYHSQQQEQPSKSKTKITLP